MIQATFSKIFLRVSGGIQFNSGTCCVRQIIGPTEQIRESSKTDKPPETFSGCFCKHEKIYKYLVQLVAGYIYMNEINNGNSPHSAN